MLFLYCGVESGKNKFMQVLQFIDFTKFLQVSLINF